MRHFVIILIILIYPAANCLADTIFLKNKESINGIITQEEEDSVVIDVGFGTMILPRAEIESIEKSDEVTRAKMREKWQRYHFGSFPAPTAQEQELVDNFEELIHKKRQIKRSVAEKESITRKISALHKDTSRLQDELYTMGEKIESADSKRNVRKYNSLILKFNSLSKELKETMHKLNELQAKHQEAGGGVVKYINQFMRFKKLFEERYENLITAGTLSIQQKDFYEDLKGRLNELQEGIRQERIKFIKHKDHVIIEAIINDKVDAMMVVDTGATLIIISADIANRLGIDYDNLKQDVKLTGIGDEPISAKFIILESVRIGNIEAKNVEAVIVKDKTFGGMDGLLGMSFLKNFSFSMDKEEQELLFNFFE